MNTSPINFKQLKNVGNWFQKHFNSLIIDEIYCNLDYEEGYWVIRSLSEDKIIKFRIDKDLYKCKFPFYKNLIPNSLNINYDFNKFQNLHFICSKNEHLENINSLIDIDLVGIIFWFLSRLEEADFNSNKDIYNRFSFQDSHIYRAKIIQKPVVDEWIYFLAFNLFGLVRYKSNYKINLTHDIDTLYRYKNKSLRRKILSKLKDSLRIKNKYNKKFIYSKNTDEPYNTFEYLMSISESRNIQSTFFFIPSNMRSPRDGDYRIDSPDIKKILILINERGHKIGVHPGYESIINHKSCINDLCCFNRLLENLNISKVEDSRMHLLRWNHPNTIYLLKKMDIKRDWTLGFPQAIGFRSATCNTYSLIDPKTFEDCEILENNLNIMDFTLNSEVYMGAEKKELLIDKIKDLEEITRNFNGSLNLLWHNNEVAWERERLFYEKILLCLE